MSNKLYIVFGNTKFKVMFEQLLNTGIVIAEDVFAEHSGWLSTDLPVHVARILFSISSSRFNMS